MREVVRHPQIEGMRFAGMFPRAQPLVQDQIQLHHSIHSLERFYTREKSLELL